MPSKVNLSSYAIKNRFLRYGKRYRQYVSLPTNPNDSNRKFNSLTILILITIVFAFVIIWFIVYYADEYSNSVDSIKTKKLPNVKISKVNFSETNHSQAFNNFSHGLNYNDNLFQFGKVFNESDQIKKETGFRIHAFNTLVSERIGLRRTLPDTRHQLCKNNTYESIAHHRPLLDTSVIICFYNEDFATLLRTIYTLLDRTPSELLKEIILVDDYSDNHIGEKLEEYMKQAVHGNVSDSSLFTQKVYYHRTPERAGLIRARLYGTHFAKGQVLFFLDSHCEVNVNWLPPLLERIQKSRQTVVCPIIDLIDPDTFKYSPSPIVKGGFNWGLHFKWDSVASDSLASDQDFVKPIMSPTMAGGLFAIERDYFFELGSYDKGMDIWGGENIEISFRIWMCGGRLEIIPCSRVGHVFRRRRPYGSPEGVDTLAYNSLRVANVWMDDYKKHFLATRSDLADMQYGNIDSRIELRRKLNCHTFEWYLQNIYPDLLTPEQELAEKAKEENSKKINLFSHKTPKIFQKFSIQLADTDLCLESDSELVYKKSKLSLQKCSSNNRKQFWKETVIHDIRLGPKSCLEASQGKEFVRLSKCHEMGGTQQWQHESLTNTQLYNVGSGMCLSIKSPFSLEKLNRKLSDEDLSGFKLFMSYCENKDEQNLNKSKEKFILNRWNLI